MPERDLLIERVEPRRLKPFATSATNRHPTTVRRTEPSPPRMLVPPTMIPVRTVNVRKVPADACALRVARRVDRAGERGGHPAQGVRRDADRVDPNAAEPRRLGVAARRVDVSPERRPAQQDRPRRPRARSSSMPRSRCRRFSWPRTSGTRDGRRRRRGCPGSRSPPIPPTTNDIASVPISGLMRNRVTMTPFASPAARPTPRTRAIPTGGPGRQGQLGRGRAGKAVHGADREVDPARDEHERAGRRDDDHRRLLVEDVGRFWNRRNGPLMMTG